MYKIISDECMDSADWVEEVSGYRPVDDIITLEELNKLSEKLDIDTLANHWDFPLTDFLDMVRSHDEDIEDEEEIVLVRFSDGTPGGYIYRFCEI